MLTAAQGVEIVGGTLQGVGTVVGQVMNSGGIFGATYASENSNGTSLQVNTFVQGLAGTWVIEARGQQLSTQRSNRIFALSSSFRPPKHFYPAF
jgi:hypothetical protein